MHKCLNTKIIVLTSSGYHWKTEEKIMCLRACNPHKGIGKFDIEYLAEYEEYEEVSIS